MDSWSEAEAKVHSTDDLDRLVSVAEDLVDVMAAKTARAEIENGAPTIPWNQVKADLGLS